MLKYWAVNQRCHFLQNNIIRVGWSQVILRFPVRIFTAAQFVSVYIRVASLCLKLAAVLMCVFLSLQGLFEPAVPSVDRLTSQCGGRLYWSLLFYSPLSSFSACSGFSRCLCLPLVWVRLVWFGAFEAGGRGCEVLIFFWLLVGEFGWLWEELICCWFEWGSELFKNICPV